MHLFREYVVCPRIDYSFHVTGKLPDDKRGGGRSGEKYKELTLAVKNDISLYKCRESYYSREKSRRGYLPSNLTLR